MSKLKTDTVKEEAPEIKKEAKPKLASPTIMKNKSGGNVTKNNNVREDF